MNAFDVLVTRYQTRMFRLARTLTGGDRDAEDLVQETFVRAFRAIRGFRGDSSFRTWLHRIAVNVVRTHLARRPRHVVEPEGNGDAGEGQSTLARIPSAEDLEDAVVRRRTIDRALATLSEEARLLITLRDVQGIEYHEIARITGLPIGTVESRIFRARRKLRPLLEPLLVDGRRSRTRWPAGG